MSECNLCARCAQLTSYNHEHTSQPTAGPIYEKIYAVEMTTQ